MDRERGRDRRFVLPFHCAYISFLAGSTSFESSAHRTGLQSVEKLPYLLCIVIGTAATKERDSLGGDPTSCPGW
jgi:hypothetical protein